MARKRRKPPEEDLRHAAWAIPYADLVTLLFAFFVVLYAVSSVNEGKYRALSRTLFTEFNGQKPPGSAPGSAPGSIVVSRPYPGTAGNTPADPSHEIFADTATVTRKQAEEIARSQAESQALDKVASDVSAAMSDLIKSDLVAVRRKGSTIEVEIRTDILFPSGSATLSPTAVGVIRKLSQTLAQLPNPVRVEGHTDSQPIETAAFPSNWELSAARAASVVHLIANSGIDPARLSVIGRAQYSPVQSNATVAGRNANRRVLIAILPPGNAAPDAGPAPAPTPTQANAAAPGAQ
ncbi:MAG TPA: flagellar motor protein MotD [Steroidobacteraceae bacterium]|nr:flagellar motor protein MotD [Steroidobacteraceae bacterium]